MTMSNRNSKTKNSTFKLAFSSICLALCVVLLLFSTFPIGFDKLLTLFAGFLVFLITKELGFKWGILFFVAASLLSLLIVPAKTELAIFIICFGPFALVLSGFYKIEKMKEIVRAVLSVVLMTALMSLVAFLFISLFADYSTISIFGKSIELALPIIVLGFGVLSGIICYIVYNPLSDILLSRIFGGAKKKTSNNGMPSIVIPKLYDDAEEEKDDSIID